MKKIMFFVILVLHTIAFGQESWQITWVGKDQTKITKHPKESFKDSLSLHNYLSQFQQVAISKGYLLASCDSISFKSKQKTAFKKFFAARWEISHLKLILEKKPGNPCYLHVYSILYYFFLFLYRFSTLSDSIFIECFAISQTFSLFINY